MLCHTTNRQGPDVDYNGPIVDNYIVCGPIGRSFGFMQKKENRYLVLLHIIFWLVFLSFKFFDYVQNLSAAHAFQLIAVQNSFNIAASYLHYFLLLPFLLQERKYVIYALGLVGLMALMIWLRGWTESIVLNGFFNTDYYQKWDMARIANLFWGIGSFILFTSFLKFTFDRFLLERQKRSLENEKLNAELNYLKAQINPHFLFNTLHNLNYLTQSKSDRATEVVIRLSNIMRYMIYESNKDKVSLTKELEFIRDYLNLEEIRLNHDFDIIFKIDLDQSDVEIAPLILMPFVENAFKHGVSDKYPESWVKIMVSVKTDTLFLEVENSVYERNPGSEDSGFGLENVRKRLALSYPERFDLAVNDLGDVYDVKLKIQLR